MPLPDFLTQRGIVSVSDNVPDGHQVRAPAGQLLSLFEEEILQATTRQPPEQPARAQPKGSDADAKALDEALAALAALAARRDRGAP